jgi:PAS domain S-box-containing protein/putative nucleotidyltransferase with HDIG domain
MTRDEILYLFPYLISLVVSAGVLTYTWRRRQAPGVSIYVWYAGAQTVWVLAFILELISPHLDSKIFWDSVQWLATVMIVVAFPLFAQRYTGRKASNRQWTTALLAFPALFALALVTDRLHHLIYPNPSLSSALPFPELLYDFTPLVVGFAVYSYLVALWGFGMLVRHLFQPHNLYRAQTAVLIVGFLIPILGTVATLFGLPIAPQRDATPFTGAIANAIIAYGLFRYRLFEIAPVGRDKLFEAIVDPVVILDNQNRVLDINTAMLALLGNKAEQVIGEPAKKVFEGFPIPIKRYTHVSYAREEVAFEISGKHIYYEMTVWPLYGPNKQITGRIYISHDITALKELEHELRELNVDLEKRVRSRTRELAEAYDVTLEGWAKALELRDKETEGHSRRVTETTLQVARAMGIEEEEELEHIRRGALLHDIGKMGIPDQILRKEGTLSDEERAIVSQHPQTAYDLLKSIPFLEKALEIPYCHHERWAGDGYPRKLKGREIPVSARIFAIVDVWDALLSDRPYRKAMSREEAMRYLTSQAGKHFDPRVVNVFLGLVEKGGI